MRVCVFRSHSTCTMSCIIIMYYYMRHFYCDIQMLISSTSKKLLMVDISEWVGKVPRLGGNPLVVAVRVCYLNIMRNRWSKHKLTIARFHNWLFSQVKTSKHLYPNQPHLCTYTWTRTIYKYSHACKSMWIQWRLSIATTSGPHKSGLSREVVSLQRSKSIAQALLGYDQVVFIERWTLDTSGI